MKLESQKSCKATETNGQLFFVVVLFLYFLCCGGSHEFNTSFYLSNVLFDVDIKLDRDIVQMSILNSEMDYIKVAW